MKTALTGYAQTHMEQTSARSDAIAVPQKHLFYVALFITSLAFLHLIPSEDALSTSFGPARLYETALVMIGLGLVPAYFLLRGRRVTLEFIHYRVVLAFCVLALVSTTWSIAPTITFNKALELAFVGFGTALFSTCFDRVRRADHDLADTIAIVMIVMVLVTLIANAAIFGNPFYLVGTKRPRLMAAYGHPSDLGDFSSYGLIALLVSRLDWRFKTAALPLLILVKELTDTRSATGGLLLAIALMFLLGRGLRAWLLTLYGIACGLLVYCFYAQQTSPLDIFGPIRPALPHDLNSLDGRTNVWSYSMTFIRHNPVTGIGYNASRILLLPKFYWAGNAHSNWVEILLTTGIIGLALLVMFVVGSFATAIHTRDRLLFGILIYQTTGSIFGVPFFTPGLAMVLVVLCLNDARARQRFAFRKRRATARGAFALHLPPLLQEHRP